MANIVKFNSTKYYGLPADNCYQVTGPITIEDVKKINSNSKPIYLILDNTKGQNPEILNRIDSKKATISVRGGLDYFKKNKFNNHTYIDRTLHTPQELASIIRYFEKIEHKIRPTWTPIEKSMFIYKSLAEDLHYVRDDEDEYENGKDISRSLSGLLYGRLVCAGFSLVFKEMMDRQGIPCVYQNKPHRHCWNVIKIEGEYYAVDLTADCVKKKDNFCGFIAFGQDENFYKSRDSRNIIDTPSEEVVYNLKAFPIKKLQAHYHRIEQGLHRETQTIQMKNQINEDLKYTKVKEINGVGEYIVAYDNKIAIIYLDSNQPLETMLNRRNIEIALSRNNGYIGLFKLTADFPKSNMFTRADGTSFVIRPTGKSIQDTPSHTVYEFAYVEVNPKTGSIRIADILSENRLDLEVDPLRKQVIANKLLSFDRLKDKMNNYNGYVGYIKDDSSRYFNEAFEREYLNIHAR